MFTLFPCQCQGSQFLSFRSYIEEENCETGFRSNGRRRGPMAPCPDLYTLSYLSLSILKIYPPPRTHWGKEREASDPGDRGCRDTCGPQSFTQAFNRPRRVSRALYLALSIRTNRGEDFVRAEFRACGEGHGLGFQFRINVMGVGLDSSTRVLIKNRPSRERAYCVSRAATPPVTMCV